MATMRGHSPLAFQEFFIMPTDGSDDQKKLYKEAFKEAIKEWLDEKMAQFGLLSLGTIAALSIGALAWFIMKSQGWEKTH
jgi:hypothetical protein